MNFTFDSSTPSNELIDLYINLRKTAPVYWSKEHNAWIISRYSDVIDCLSNHDLYTYENTDSVVVRDLIFMSKNQDTISESDRKFFQIPLPPDYQIYRKQLLDIYHAAISNNLNNKIINNINKIFSDVSNKDRIDFVKEVTNYIPLLTICDMMGYKHQMLNAIYEITSSFTEESTVQDRVDITKRAFNLLKTSPPPLITESADKKSAMSFCIGMMLGGTNSLSGSLPELLKNIFIYEKYFNDVINNTKLINNFIQETLRHTFIQSNLIRVASRDIDMHNKKIKKGDIVAILLGSANFDEARFGDDANEFNIYRNFNKTNLVFGHGMYRCIGFQTAMLEQDCFMNFIIANYKKIKIDKIIESNKRNFSGSLIKNIYGSYSENEQLMI